jgi:hypothetical protein
MFIPIKNLVGFALQILTSSKSGQIHLPAASFAKGFGRP